MAGDDELVIDIPDDDLEGIEDSNEAPKAKKADGAEEGERGSAWNDLKDQVQSLTKQRDDDRKARERAESDRRASEERERRARDDAAIAQRDAAVARTEGVEGQRVAIENAIAASKQALDAAEAELASAGEAGDWKKIAAAQRRIGETAAELKQLEAGKASLPAATEGRVDTRREERRVPTEDEKFDRYIGQFKPRVQDWLRKHPECVKDQSKNERVIRAHHVAMDQGLEDGSDEYFDFLDQKMGYATDDSGGDNVKPNGKGGDPSLRAVPQQRQQPRQENRSMRVAPVSREGGGGSGGGGGGTQVTLTAGEQRNATDGTLTWNYDDPNGKFKKGDPIGIREMARRKAKMLKEGRYEIPYAS